MALIGIHAEVTLQTEFVTEALVEIQAEVPRLAILDVFRAAYIDGGRGVVAEGGGGLAVVVGVADSGTERGLTMGEHHVVGQFHIIGMGVPQSGITLGDEQRVGEVAVANGLQDVGQFGREAVVQLKTCSFAELPYGSE